MSIGVFSIYGKILLVYSFNTFIFFKRILHASLNTFGRGFRRQLRIKGIDQWEKSMGRKWHLSTGFALSYSRWNFQTNQRGPVHEWSTGACAGIRRCLSTEACAGSCTWLVYWSLCWSCTWLVYSGLCWDWTLIVYRSLCWSCTWLVLPEPVLVLYVTDLLYMSLCWFYRGLVYWSPFDARVHGWSTGSCAGRACTWLVNWSLCLYWTLIVYKSLCCHWTLFIYRSLCLSWTWLVYRSLCWHWTWQVYTSLCWYWT